MFLKLQVILNAHDTFLSDNEIDLRGAVDATLDSCRDNKMCFNIAKSNKCLNFFAHGQSIQSLDVFWFLEIAFLFNNFSVCDET